MPLWCALRLGALVILLFLLLSCAACSTNPLVRPPLDLPAANLLVKCDKGLPVPEGDVLIATLTDVVSSKVQALDECAVRHEKLSDYVLKAAGK